MSNTNIKIGETVKVVYQATGTSSAAVCNMNVYDTVDALVSAQSGSMTQIGSTGRFFKTFVPDADGVWSTQSSDNFGGKAVAAFAVGNYNIDAVGANVVTVENKVDAVLSAVQQIPTPLSPPMMG